MSQLPGTIHIKRKLEEEPPSTLFIESEGQDPRHAEQNARPVYRLFKRTRLTDPTSPQQPAVQSPKAGIHGPIFQPAPALSLASGSLDESSANKPQAESSGSGKLQVSNEPRPRRVFHLSSKAASLSRSSSASSLRGISRRRGRHASSVAVFAERRARKLDLMARSMMSSRPTTPALTDDEDMAQTQARKRPLTMSNSSQRIADLSLSASKISAEQDDNEATMKLAAELRQFALETSGDTITVSEPTPTVVQSLKKKPMKYQPRSPPPRNAGNTMELAGISDTPGPTITGEVAVEEDEAGEWVYDIYVRDIIPPEQGIHNPGSLVALPENSLSHENVGYIVIRTEDEEAWEEFMSDQEDSENEWGGDDEDSNAEEYYANEYPDELDSDDEWALGRDSEEEYDLNDEVSDREH